MRARPQNPRSRFAQPEQSEEVKKMAEVVNLVLQDSRLESWSSKQAKELLATALLSQLRAKKMVLELVRKWNQDRPAEVLEDIAVVFRRFPAAVVEKCCHPVDGIAPAYPVYFPSIGAITKWCEAEMSRLRVLAADLSAHSPTKPLPPKPATPEEKSRVQKKLQEFKRGLAPSVSDAVPIERRPDDAVLARYKAEVEACVRPAGVTIEFDPNTLGA
jgi:hypothetical protein